MESEDDDWELCYDDGFVYKRKRRRLNPPEPVNSSEPDSEILRKERKKHTLLKLKSKYEKEILQWENLSNTLRSLQISSSPQLQQQQQQQQQHQTLSLPSTSSSTQSNLLDDLLSQPPFINSDLYFA
ncbi:hypothetical protein L195_g032038 [Trifolium pratense]|uniref:Uncharacterized protein n=1 Tax=Trifolium pratense TaxID=57577 RepID=A0A2K3L938_TRIPR|nr:hypothetical protein L195_g030979 [Trifolium pratense]PNX76066.1 hypothetical protein L195_g032011 [Trifolium pratense]PNX76093.1 hypothetical protein L195_g032038 [Trifolium pratense]